MASEWNYGDCYIHHPCETGTAVFDDGSKLKTHDIFNPLPKFMREADLIFTDSPWNRGNLHSFYTKAGIDFPDTDFQKFMDRLFECVAEIRPKICYLEIGREFLADYIMRMRELYKNVTFFNSTYYHNASNKCYIVRGGDKRTALKLDDVDEEDAISEIISAEGCVIGDLCMGRGLVACAAQKNGKRFVGTELNHKRLSVALDRLTRLAGNYHIEEDK